MNAKIIVLNNGDDNDFNKSDIFKSNNYNTNINHYVEI